MNVQQKIEKWCRNERFVHYANERISEELVYAPNHRIDPEYEELDEAITWDNRYIVPMMTYLTYRLQLVKLQKNAKNRYKHDIHSCYKARLADRTVLQTDLLQVRSNTKECTTNDSTCQQSFFILFIHCSPLLLFCPGTGLFSCPKPDYRKQHHRTDQRTGCRKRKRPYIIHSDTLCHKCNAPDKCSKK